MAAFTLLATLSLGVPAVMLIYWLVVGHSHAPGLPEISDAIGGSLLLAIPGAVLTVALAMPLVFAAVRHGGRLSRLADRLPYVVHGLPGLVIALSLVYLSIHYAHPVYQTMVLLLVAYATLFLPLAQSALRSSIELMPKKYEEIARGLGRSSWIAFASVVLPNIVPGIGAALALVVLEIMRELTATLLLAPIGIVTLSTEVWSHTNDGEYAAAAPFAALMVASAAIPVYIFTRRGTGVSGLR